MNIFSKITNFILSIKIWHLVLVFIVCLPTSIWLLRQNNLKMIELRDNVVAVDQETGDIKKVEPALVELGEYVLGHMNTSLGAALELPGTYNAAVEKARKKAERSGTANADVYKRAQTVCEKPDVLLSVRAQCIQEYVLANAKPGTDPTELEFPPKELYSYNFDSPRWSFDLAGVFVLITALSGIAIIWYSFAKFLIPAINNWIASDPLE